MINQMSKIPEMPKGVWENVKPLWEQHAIPIGRFGEDPERAISARLMRIEAPEDRILAVPVLVPMQDKGLLMLSCNTEYAEKAKPFTIISIISKSKSVEPIKAR